MKTSTKLRYNIGNIVLAALALLIAVLAAPKFGVFLSVSLAGALCIMIRLVFATAPRKSSQEGRK